MPRKLDPVIVDNAIEAIRLGDTIKAVAQKFGVSPDALSRNIRKRGVQIPRPQYTPDRTFVPVQEIITMYEQGQSEYAIARHFGCSRNVIRRHLRRANIPIRHCRDAALFRYRESTKESRQQLTFAARKAWEKKGFFTRQELLAAAQKREKSGNFDHVGPGETEFAAFLDNLGITYTAQKAIDIYNADFAIGTVAVELTCGTVKYRGGDATQNKRIKKFLECGYKPILVEFSDARVIPLYLHNIVAIIQEASSLPSFERQYWMIRCYRKNSTVIRNHLGQFSSVPIPEQFFCDRKTVYL